MTPRRLAYVIGFLLATYGAPAFAQARPRPYAGRVEEPAASYLARNWKPDMPERAYCVTGWYVDAATGDRMVVVTDVKDAPSDSATRDNVYGVRCGAKPVLHTHPPRACWLSGQDIGAALLEAYDPFVASQCYWQAFAFAIAWDRVDAIAARPDSIRRLAGMR